MNHAMSREISKPHAKYIANNINYHLNHQVRVIPLKVKMLQERIFFTNMKYSYTSKHVRPILKTISSKYRNYVIILLITGSCRLCVTVDKNRGWR